MIQVVLFFLIGLLLPFFSFSQTEKANKQAVDTPVVLKNVRIVDGTGALIKHDQTLIIRSGKIGAIWKGFTTTNSGRCKSH
jgi:hypothetical protein